MNREEALEMTNRGVDELIAALEQGKSERLLEYLAYGERSLIGCGRPSRSRDGDAPSSV